MSLEDLGIIGYKAKVLLVDGDILIYKPCCIFNEDTDGDRRMIAKTINQKLEKLMTASECDSYMMFVTTKFNFRDQLTHDYKANRKDIVRPVNLAWAKKWAVKNLSNVYKRGLEADDLLGIYAGENRIIWSTDKDLRQIEGEHLDDDLGMVHLVTKAGLLRLVEKTSPTTGKVKKEVYFEGMIGLYYQMLTGDNTDNIIGCGKRLETVVKTGKNKGQTKLKRFGVGPLEAYNGMLQAVVDNPDKPQDEAALDYVILRYKQEFKDEWQYQLELQGNLLFMVREMVNEDVFKRWTYDGRDEYFDLEKGVIVTKEELEDYAKDTR